MGKPRKLGKKSTYIPNTKADMRRHKKIFLRGRLKAYEDTGRKPEHIRELWGK